MWYQPGFPKSFNVHLLSYNLNILPWGARLAAGAGHDHSSERLQEFISRPELNTLDVLLLQEVFKTPLPRGLLCQQERPSVHSQPLSIVG